MIRTRRFTCKQADGWYLVTRLPNEYHSEPIDGWRVWWWRLRVNIEGIWWAMSRL